MKRFSRLFAVLILCGILAACGEKPEPSASVPAQTDVPATSASEASSEVPSGAPSEAPAEPEDLLAWGGKTLSAYGAAWAGQQGFQTVDIKATDEEDADCAACIFSFADSAEKHPGLTAGGSLFLGKDASVLFDIPEEAEIDPLAEGFLAGQVKALLPEAKEETMTVGSTVWNVRTFCQEAQADGHVVYDLIAWNEADGVLAYVNASAVVRGDALGEKDAEAVSALMQDWFSSLEIR